MVGKVRFKLTTPRIRTEYSNQAELLPENKDGRGGQIRTDIFQLPGLTLCAVKVHLDGVNGAPYR